MMENVEVITYTTPDDKYVLIIEIDWENHLISNMEWDELNPIDEEQNG